nr:phosphatase PAP2 family protein [Ktedonobacteraceae bacterium]
MNGSTQGKISRYGIGGLRIAAQVAPFVQLVLFLLLARWVRRHPISATDVRITHAFQRQRAAWVRTTVGILTYVCGSPPIFRTAATLIALVLWKMQLRLEAYLTLAITLSSALLKNGLQQAINRPRPSPLLVEVHQKSKGKSFPSGHVTTALTFWGWFMALAAIRLKKKNRWQKLLLGSPALLIGLTGPTRIYLGDHWASDVLGGYLFGGAWLGIFVQLYKRLRLREK